MNIAILGLSITSSWGNGHATTYRSLIRGMKKRGHNIVFLERDVPWYASNRDMPVPEFCKVILYSSVEELKNEYSNEIINADVVITGSYVPDGIEVGKWVTDTAQGIKAFYDIDTPVTLKCLRDKSCTYLSPELIARYDIYLSFTAGRCLEIFENEFGSPKALPFYCSVDPELYFPLESKKEWDLGYLGTYSSDRQPGLDKLLTDAARKWDQGKFFVAGPQFPESIVWPSNVKRVEHLPPSGHNLFYNSQRYTLNVTRHDMIEMGYSPSVRLFEAAACGVPVISDYWEGIETILVPGEEILISHSSDDTLRYLKHIPEWQRYEIGIKARDTILKKHTGEKRSLEFDTYISELKQKETTRQL